MAEECDESHTHNTSKEEPEQLSNAVLLLRPGTASLPLRGNFDRAKKYPRDRRTHPDDQNKSIESVIWNNPFTMAQTGGRRSYAGHGQNAVD